MKSNLAPQLYTVWYSTLENRIVWTLVLHIFKKKPADGLTDTIVMMSITYLLSTYVLQLDYTFVCSNLGNQEVDGEHHSHCGDGG